MITRPVKPQQSKITSTNKSSKPSQRKPATQKPKRQPVQPTASMFGVIPFTKASTYKKTKK